MRPISALSIFCSRSFGAGIQFSISSLSSKILLNRKEHKYKGGYLLEDKEIIELFWQRSQQAIAGIITYSYTKLQICNNSLLTSKIQYAIVIIQRGFITRVFWGSKSFNTRSAYSLIRSNRFLSSGVIIPIILSLILYGDVHDAF